MLRYVIMYITIPHMNVCQTAKHFHSLSQAVVTTGISIFVNINISYKIILLCLLHTHRGRRGREYMVVGFTTIIVSSNHVLARCTPYNIICQWLVAGQWFSPGPPVSSTNKTGRHHITEILLKVALITITLTLITYLYMLGKTCHLFSVDCDL